MNIIKHERLEEVEDKLKIITIWNKHIFTFVLRVWRGYTLYPMIFECYIPESLKQVHKCLLVALYERFCGTVFLQLLVQSQQLTTLEF